MALKFTTSSLIAIVLASHSLGGTISAFGSVVQNSLEVEESKRQKIYRKINKQYPTWTEEEKQQVGDLSVQFFQECLIDPYLDQHPKTYSELLNFFLKAFLNCSAQEAQELITMTCSLYPPKQNKDPSRPVWLLNSFTEIDSVSRPLFVNQLRRFEPKGDAYDISEELKKYKPEQYELLTNLTLEFFKDHSIISQGAARWAFEIFSTCPSEEAQELITMTQTLLSNMSQDKEDLWQANLLGFILKTEKKQRDSAYLPLLKITRGFEGDLRGFFKLYSKFVELDPSQYEWMADQLVRFGPSKENNKFSIDEGNKIIDAFKNLPSENQSLFSDFLKSHQVTNFELIKQLVQVPPQEWAATLQYLKDQLSTFLKVNQVTNSKWAEQLAQTHPQDWVDTLQYLRNAYNEKTAYFRERYGDKPLKNVLSLLEQKIRDALDQQLLSVEEYISALQGLNRLVEVKLKTEPETETLKHLSWMYQYLQDKEKPSELNAQKLNTFKKLTSLFEITSKDTTFSKQELAERWASWIKNSLINKWSKP